MQKCDLCGGDPACADGCPTGAITYVDADWTGLDKMPPGPSKLGNQPAALKEDTTCHGQEKSCASNLTAGTVKSEPLNMEWAQAYLGSRGLATKYLVEEVDPKVDPLSPANKLIWATGPLTGTMASTGGRYYGGHQGAADRRHRLLQLGRLLGRRAEDGRLGHGHLRGQVAKPVYLSIEDDEAELRDAAHLWGKTRLGDRGDAQEAAPGSADARLLASAGRREPGAVRRGRQRPAPCRRPFRRRRRDGQQEPEGDRRARHQGRGQHRRPQGLHEGHGREEEDPGRQRRHRPGPADLRHAGADERDQRNRRAADAQPPRRAVRGRQGHLGRGDGHAAQDRRQGATGDQPGLLRLHHRLRSHQQDRRDATSRSRTSRSTGAPPAASNTKRPGRWARPTASTTWKRCSTPTCSATSTAWTRSPSAPPSAR